MQKQLSKKIEREIRILAAKLPTAYYKRQGAVGVLNYVRGMIDLNADHPRELSLGGIQFTL